MPAGGRHHDTRTKRLLGVRRYEAMREALEILAAEGS